MTPIEYLSTAADLPQPVPFGRGFRAPQIPDPIVPDGHGWELVNTAAVLDQTIVWTWRRQIKPGVLGSLSARPYASRRTLLEAGEALYAVLHARLFGGGKKLDTTPQFAALDQWRTLVPGRETKR